MDYTACDQSYNGKMMLNLVSLNQDRSVRGLGKALLNNQAINIDIDAIVDSEDIITGDVVMVQGNEFFGVHPCLRG